MKTRSTIIDIAEVTGLTPQAVSLALRGQPGVSEDTRERVKGAAQFLDYVPTLAARTIRNSKSGVIAMVSERVFPDVNIWVALIQRANYLPVLLLNDERLKARLIGVRAEGVLWFGANVARLPMKTVKVTRNNPEKTVSELWEKIGYSASEIRLEDARY